LKEAELLEVVAQLRAVETTWASQDKSSFNYLNSRYKALSEGYSISQTASISKGMTVYKAEKVIQPISSDSTFRMKVDD